MSGVRAVRYLLANHSPLTAVIPAAQIMAGDDLPMNTVLPAILVAQISSVPVNNIQINESPKAHVDRVQVTWFFKGPEGSPSGTGYVGVNATDALVRAACPSQRGTINGVAVDAIWPAEQGPDLSSRELAVQSRSRDLMVRWHE